MYMAGQVLEHLTAHREATRSEVCHIYDFGAARIRRDRAFGRIGDWLRSRQHHSACTIFAECSKHPLSGRQSKH